MSHRIYAIPFAALALVAVGCRPTPQTDSTVITGAAVPAPFDAGPPPSSAGGDMAAGVAPSDATGPAPTSDRTVAPAQPNVAQTTAVPEAAPLDRTTASGATAWSDAGPPRAAQGATTDEPTDTFQGSSFGNTPP
jgi:hypothetical protein